MASGLILGAVDPDTARQAWSDYLHRQDKLIGAAKLGNWLTVASTAVSYYAIRRNTLETVAAIKHASRDQIWEAQENTKQMLRALSGIEDQIADSMLDLRRVIDMRLGMVGDQIAIGNAVARDILEILHVPDFQKERRYYYEQGLRHYANARFDDSLYTNALQNFGEAEKREGSDPQVLYRIGLIYLYSPTECDLAKAEEYLQGAAKFAFIYAQPGASVAPHVLRLVDDKKAKDDHGRFAATVFTDLSVAFLAQRKLADATKAAQQAVELDSHFLPSRIQTVRCWCAESRAEVTDAVVRLLTEHPEAAVGFLGDEELTSFEPVQRALQLLREEDRRRAGHLVPELLKRLDGLPAAFNEVMGGRISSISNLVDAVAATTDRVEKGELAIALRQLLTGADSELSFNRQELNTQFSVSGDVHWVHLADEGRTCLIVAGLTESLIKTEFASYSTRYELLSVALHPGGVKVTKVEVTSTHKGVARGTLSDNGKFVLEGVPQLFDARDLSSTALQSAPSCPVFVKDDPCDLRDNDLVRLTDLAVLRSFHPGQVTIEIGQGAAARPITLTLEPRSCVDPHLVVFAAPSGASRLPKLRIVDLSTEKSVGVVVPVSGKEIHWPVHAVASRDRKKIAVRLSTMRDWGGPVALVDMDTGDLNLTEELEGLLAFKSDASLMCVSESKGGEGIDKAWIRKSKGVSSDPKGVTVAYWGGSLVCLFPGPGADSVVHAADSFRRHIAMQTTAGGTEVEFSATPCGAPQPSVPPPLSEEKETLDQFVVRRKAEIEAKYAKLEAMSPAAKEALQAAQELEQKESKRWIGKKDWPKVAQLYIAADRLGYPFLDEDLARLKSFK